MNLDLGRYRLLERLGAGGMGEVYRAVDLELRREVAIKLLPAHLAQNPEALARFKHEARAVAALSHPNIMALYDFGAAAGVSFAVMELLQGETLRSRLERGRLAWRQAVEVALATASGLEAAHAKGIIHRDLKPENLFLTTDARLKILDFGLAGTLPQGLPSSTGAATLTFQPTEPGTLIGTVGYMSPEQVRGEPAGRSSDLFSLGCVLYEMVSGERAFARKSGAETLTAILRDEPPALLQSSPAVPAAMETVVQRCLAKDPAQRYASAGELAQALRDLLGEEAPHRPSHDTRRRLVAHRHRRTAVAVAVALAAAAGIGGWLLLQTLRGSARFDSLAVLPFANTSAETELEYLSDGISESIGHSLSQISALKVMSRSAVAPFKGRQLDARAAGKELGVRAVVLGQVGLHGDILTVSVELVDAGSRRLLWGEKYTRRLEDVLMVQAEIARHISDNLRLRLAPEDVQRLGKHHTESPEAYRLYLEGRYHSLQLMTEGLRRGIELLNRAIAADPGYALAYAGLAASYYDASGIYMPPDEAMPKARAAALRALEIDAELAEAHVSLGQVLGYYDWNWREAQQEYERALVLNPNLAHAHVYYGYCLVILGRRDEAIAAMTRAAELDPLTPFVAATLAWCYYLDGRYDEALERSRKLTVSNPELSIGHYNTALSLVQKKMLDPARAALEKAQQLDPGSTFIAATFSPWRENPRRRAVFLPRCRKPRAHDSSIRMTRPASWSVWASMSWRLRVSTRRLQCAPSSSCIWRTIRSSRRCASIPASPS